MTAIAVTARIATMISVPLEIPDSLALLFSLESIDLSSYYHVTMKPGARITALPFDFHP